MRYAYCRSQRHQPPALLRKVEFLVLYVPAGMLQGAASWTTPPVACTDIETIRTGGRAYPGKLLAFVEGLLLGKISHILLCNPYLAHTEPKLDMNHKKRRTRLASERLTSLEMPQHTWALRMIKYQHQHQVPPLNSLLSCKSLEQLSALYDVPTPTNYNLCPPSNLHVIPV
jgi:hypothetical protein